MLKNYTELKVWQKAHDLVVKIYNVTKVFPVDEKFVLVSQIRRAAISVPANIAEGYSRKHTKEYIQMLYIAQGSLEETKYFLFLSKDLGYIKDNVYVPLLELGEEIGRMLRGLINALS